MVIADRLNALNVEVLDRVRGIHINHIELTECVQAISQHLYAVAGDVVDSAIVPNIRVEQELPFIQLSHW